MEQPPGYKQQGNDELVFRLNKAIYDLKQAPRVWFENPKSTLITLEFNSLKSDNSLFIRFSDNNVMYLLVYVNDFIIISSSIDEINILVKQLNSEFSIKDIGELHYFLSIEVKRISETTIMLSQKKYISEILSKTKMNQANSLSTSMTSNMHLSKYNGSQFRMQMNIEVLWVPYNMQPLPHYKFLIV